MPLPPLEVQKEIVAEIEGCQKVINGARADQTKIQSHYLLTVLQSGPVREFVTRNAVGAAGSMPKINQGIVESIPIPLPPLATQQAIVAEIEAEQALVAANRELITRFERKIQATLARIWGEETPELVSRLET